LRDAEDPVSHEEYEILERAITDGLRVAVVRRGTEYVVVPERLRIVTGREVIDVRHPTTGDRMTLYVDELNAIEAVGVR
jgi:hypothetical protein